MVHPRKSLAKSAGLRLLLEHNIQAIWHGRVRMNEVDTTRGAVVLHTCACVRCNCYDAAVGIPVNAYLDHIHFQVNVEEVAGQGQRAAPLPGAGLGGQRLSSCLIVVEGYTMLLKGDHILWSGQLDTS